LTGVENLEIHCKPPQKGFDPLACPRRAFNPMGYLAPDTDIERPWKTDTEALWCMYRVMVYVVAYDHGSIGVYPQQMVGQKGDRVQLEGGAWLKASNVHSTWKEARAQAIIILQEQHTELTQKLDYLGNEMHRMFKMEDPTEL
jgi:hypothetical protein